MTSKIGSRQNSTQGALCDRRVENLYFQHFFYQVDPGPACLAPVTFGRDVVTIIRGITIGLSGV
jgi:hypothetical protein